MRPIHGHSVMIDLEDLKEVTCDGPGHLRGSRNFSRVLADADHGSLTTRIIRDLSHLYLHS